MGSSGILLSNIIVEEVIEVDELKEDNTSAQQENKKNSEWLSWGVPHLELNQTKLN